MGAREDAEREAFAIEAEQRRIRAEIAGERDQRRANALRLKLQALAVDHERAIRAVMALDLLSGR